MEASCFGVVIVVLLLLLLLLALCYCTHFAHLFQLKNLTPFRPSQFRTIHLFGERPAFGGLKGERAREEREREKCFIWFATNSNGATAQNLHSKRNSNGSRFHPPLSSPLLSSSQIQARKSLPFQRATDDSVSDSNSDSPIHLGGSGSTMSTSCCEIGLPSPSAGSLRVELQFELARDE